MVDPFSSSQWTLRQVEYVRAIASVSYTPQIVINGIWECVGSNANGIMRAIQPPVPRRQRE